MKLLTLKEYEEIAIKLLSTTGQKWMMTDENIGIVIGYLCKSDMTYDENREASLKTYRFRGWLHARSKIFQTRKKILQSKTTHLTDSGWDKQYKVQKIESDDSKIFDSKVLTKKERIYLSHKFIHNMKLDDIAEKFGVTKQAVSFTINKAIDKLRKLYNVKSEEMVKELTI